MRKPTFFTATLFFVLTFMFIADGASREIIIPGTAVKKTQVVVADMTVNGRLNITALSKELTGALRFDMDNSGWFSVDRNYNLIRQILTKDLSSGGMNLREWRRTEAEMLVKTDLRVAGRKKTITCRGYDLISGNVVFEKAFSIETTNNRYLVHFLTDWIVEKQTGREGIARTKIVFSANKGTRDRHLYIMDYDGHNVKKLSGFNKVKGNLIVVAPDWGPNGDSVYFTSYHLGYPYVYKIDLGKGTLSAVSTFPGLNASVAISPRGNEMLLCLSKTGSVEIHKKSINSKKTTRLTSTGRQVSAVPRWSPDGKRIAYVSGKLGVPQIFVMDSNGRNEKRLIKGYTHTTSLDWAPKGSLIAFSATRGRRVQLFVADIKSGVVKQLTNDNANNSHPSFAPDGIHLMYVKETGYSSDLHMVDVRDLKDVKITNWKGDETYPSWSPVSFSR